VEGFDPEHEVIMTSPDLHGTTTKMATWLLRRKKHSNRQKKAPAISWGYQALTLSSR
jgi:hypothetical protein